MRLILKVLLIGYILFTASEVMAGCPKVLNGAYNGYVKMQVNDLGILKDAGEAVVHEVYTSSGSYTVDTYSAIDGHNTWTGTYVLNTSTCVGYLTQPFKNSTNGSWRIAVSNSGNDIDMVLDTPPTDPDYVNLQGYVRLTKQ